MLLQAGLEPLTITYWNTLLFPAIALVRFHHKIWPPVASDLANPPSPFAKWLFGGVLRLERGILRALGSLPFGVSVFAVARKPG